MSFSSSTLALYRILFYAVVVVEPEHDFLFKSATTYCVEFVKTYDELVIECEKSSQKYVGIEGRDSTCWGDLRWGNRHLTTPNLTGFHCIDHRTLNGKRATNSRSLTSLFSRVALA
jgi:hypothetical protein